MLSGASRYNAASVTSSGDRVVERNELTVLGLDQREPGLQLDHLVLERVSARGALLEINVCSRGFIEETARRRSSRYRRNAS